MGGPSQTSFLLLQEKKSYPPPTPCTLLLSSQVCELRLRGVIRARTTKQRILGEGSDDMEQSTLGSGGFSPSDSFLPAWFIKMTLPGDPTRILKAGKYQEGPEGGELLLPPRSQVGGVGQGCAGKTSWGNIRVRRHSARFFFCPKISL